MPLATDTAHRGREADTPGGIPARGWKDVLLRVKDPLAEHHLSIIAAGVAFYLLLSFVPALGLNLIVVGSIAFSVYVAYSDSYDATYGSLGAIAVTMAWLFLAAYSVLLGAQLNAESERQTVRDSTESRPEPWAGAARMRPTRWARQPRRAPGGGRRRGT